MAARFTSSAELRTVAAALTAAAAALDASDVNLANMPREPEPTLLPSGPNPLDYRYWFTVRQAKDHIGLSERTILDACRSGALKASQRVGGGRWRIHRDDLERWARGETS